MEQEIRQRFNDHIRYQVMERFSIAPDRIRTLDGFESFMYEFERDGGVYILRISHTLRRSVNLIQAEVDWINYLAGGGVPAARAVESVRGNLVEGVNDGQGEQFLATAFVKAAGKEPDRHTWNASLFVNYGRAIGRMHALSKRYEPPTPEARRMAWDDPDMLYVEKWLPPEETRARGHYQQVKTYIDALPKGRESYGLIHQDAHGGNFFVDAHGGLTFFDFDDCCYSWYVNDIAIVLFYAVLWDRGNDLASYTRYFMTHFLRGYAEENKLPPRWLKEIPYFLKLREIDLYAQIKRQFENWEDDAWCAHYMKDRQRRIEAGDPYIVFDFESLAVLL